MTNVQINVLALYAIVVLVAWARHVVLARTIARTPFVTPDGPRMDAEVPLVSIIVPAKDEEATIETCVRSLLEQDYRHIEILVVDDRSEDRTAEVVEGIAISDERVRLHRIEQLPDGWTGKTHALHVCQEHARGQWLLFVDADTHHHRSCLSVVLRDAIDHGVDMESLMPALDCRSFWEHTIQPFAGVCLMVFFPLPQVNDPKNKAMGFANGQFILVRRDVYDAIGGHEAVRHHFVEDVHLGRAVRRNELKLRVVMGGDLSKVRMYASLAGIIRGWSRILYSAVDCRPGKLYLLFFSILVFSVLSYVVLLVGGGLLLAGDQIPFVKMLFGLGVAHELAQTTLMARIYALSHSRQRYLLVRFLAVGVMLWIIVRTIRMCSTHTVTWRGTDYGQKLRQSV